MIRLLSDVVGHVRSDAKAAPVAAYGFPFLDECPATPGSLIVLGGRTGTGKSFLSLGLLAGVDKPGAYVSLEDPPVEVARRVAELPRSRLEQLLLVTPKRPRLSLIAREIEEAFRTGHSPRVVVIDYLQLVQYDGDAVAWSQSDQIGLVLAELKALAREYGFIVVVVCQLRRPGRDDGDMRPTIWDLRDSSNIENSAEAVVLLHAQGDDRVEAWLAKNKSGRFGASMTFMRGANGFLRPLPSEADLDIFGDNDPRPSAPIIDLFGEAA